jgi:hypothetical protein
MSELIGLFVLGLALAIGCSLMLSSQLDHQSSDTADIGLRGDERMADRLERLANPPLQMPEPTVGVILEPTGRSSPLPLRRPG